MSENPEILEFHDNPQKWRIIGLVMIAAAFVIVFAFWKFGGLIIGESFSLTMIRMIVSLVSLVMGVFGFTLIRLPIRDLAFDSVYRTLNLREKFVFSTNLREIRFAEIKDVFVEVNELENSTDGQCFIELRDGERIEIPIADKDPDAVCSQLVRFIGLEK